MKTSIVTRGSVAEVSAPVDSLAGGQGRTAMARAINHTLGKTETAVNRALVKQTGLKYGAVKREMKRYSANAGKLEGEIKGSGNHHKLSQFGARKTRRGVSAAPWGIRRVFPSTFFIGNAVVKRLGAARFPVKALYGPAIPKEMVKDQAQTAFDNTVSTELPKRVDHELARLFRR